jgi:hypothetical protein
MKLYNPDGTELMTITRVKPTGRCLTIEGSLFGGMPIRTQLRPEQARAGLKLLTFGKFLFLISLFCRRGPRDSVS